MKLNPDYHRWFYYSNGILLWKERPSNRVRVGDIVGTINKGYVGVVLNKRRYERHRIVWEMFNGPIPGGMCVDHLNGIAGDDRIENLQLVTKQMNESLATYRLVRTNKTGVNNVSYDASRNKFYARFRHLGKIHHVGRFSSLEEAKAAVISAKSKLGIVSRRDVV